MRSEKNSTFIVRFISSHCMRVKKRLKRYKCAWNQFWENLRPRLLFIHFSLMAKTVLRNADLSIFLFYFYVGNISKTLFPIFEARCKRQNWKNINESRTMHFCGRNKLNEWRIDLVFNMLVLLRCTIYNFPNKITKIRA